MTTPEELKRYVRDVPDYPQKGIIFRDITPLLGDKKVFAEVVDLMSKAWAANPPDLVAAIEARGFIPGSAMAVKLGAGFVPIRKTGKLPWTTVMGISNTNVDPLPGAESTESWPPMSFTSSAAIVSPSPVPPKWRRVESSA